MIRLLVVAPARAMRVGLQALFKDSSDLQVIGEAASLAEAWEALPEVDVVVLAGEVDLSFEAGGPSPESTLPAMLLLGDEAQQVQEVAAQGWRAWGALTSDAALEELFAAVHAVNQGLITGTPALIEPLLSREWTTRRVSLPQGEELTAREREVLQFLAQGLANKQIGLAMGISEHTVKFHVSSVYTKLGATNRTEAVRLGVQHGLIAL